MNIPKDQQSCRTAIFRCYRIPYVEVTEGYHDSRSDLSFVDKLYSIPIKLVNGEPSLKIYKKSRLTRMLKVCK